MSAFEDALAAERQHEGSDFALAREAAGSNRALADELGVSIRTVQRWANYDAGTGKESRNPAASPRAGDLKAMADVQRNERALDRMAGAESFEADIDVEYETDQGSRSAYNVGPFSMAGAVEQYRSGAPLADVDAAVGSAIAESYGLPAAVEVTGVSNLSLH